MPTDNEKQGQKEVMPVLIRNPWRIFAIEAFLFCVTLGLGIVTAFKINKIFKIEEITIPQISFWKFILYFLLVTLFILLVSHFLKFKKGKGILFKALFALTVFWGGILLLSCWIPDVPALIVMTFLVFWWLKKPSVLIQDLCLILGMAGAGGILGLSLNPLIVVLILVIFSIYDFIAVYKTKHMVKMAKEMIESKAILALVVPPNFSGLRESLEKIKPGREFLILGGGDIVFPLLFCVALIPQGLLTSFIVAVFSLLGLFAGFWFFVSQKTRQPIPALPPIALFSIIGFLITKLI
jgi:presenilin-like A22 family membrane protease